MNKNNNLCTCQSKEPKNSDSKSNITDSKTHPENNAGELKCTCGPPPTKCTQQRKGDGMPIIPQKEVRRFIYDCLVAAGAAAEHASIHADMIMFADTRGKYSEGMNRLEMYCSQLKSRKINGKETPVIIRETSSTAYVDGKSVLGATTGCFCMDLAIKKAKVTGIGFVVCKNSSNYGCGSFYTDRAVKNNLIGFAYSNGIATVIPTRATEPAIGSNQIAFAAPISFNDSLSADFSTSIASIGHVEMLYKQKKSLPEGWAMSNGIPVTDPVWVLKNGGLLPLGGLEESAGHKGYALCLMIDVLTGILSGGEFGPKITKDRENPSLSQSFLVINPDMFANGFSERMKWIAYYIRHMTAATEGKNVEIPGDGGRRNIENVEISGGITYLKAQMGQCLRLADEYKVKPLGEAKPNV